MTGSLQKERPCPPFRGLGGFTETYYPLASLVGERLGIDPVLLLAEAALESGWGESVLAKEHFNFFGVAAYSPPNDFWNGDFVELSEDSPRFRKYESAEQGFMDYGSGFPNRPPNPLKGRRNLFLDEPEGDELYSRELKRAMEFIKEWVTNSPLERG